MTRSDIPILLHINILARSTLTIKFTKLLNNNLSVCVSFFSPKLSVFIRFSVGHDWLNFSICTLSPGNDSACVSRTLVTLNNQRVTVSLSHSVRIINVSLWVSVSVRIINVSLWVSVTVRIINMSLWVSVTVWG
jgi:hypothetical protein